MEAAYPLMSSIVAGATRGNYVTEVAGAQATFSRGHPRNQTLAAFTDVEIPRSSTLSQTTPILWVYIAVH